ncbi:hypothetical protein [Herminiimonas sp. CN]|uniref:hypothetical protein n=1 Tax=Herminiimonas sp. CN TaxID=1349818 RepID=UPI000474408D|nr:hypothetical protein [Herminiimonas sp. CN]
MLQSPDSTSPAKFQRKAWVSVGTLPLLRIGDIWRNGQLELAPDYELAQFLDLEINAQTAVLVKAGLNLEEKGFLLPRTEHPWHMACTQSYCLMVELPQNRRLIIPCMELIRFYFGSSSNLLTKLFLPPLSRDTLYSKPHFDKTSGRLTLQLAADTSQSLIGTTAPPVEQVAIGEPGSERRIRSMDLAVLSRPESEKQQPVPEFLQDAVKELMQLQGLHIELLTESEDDGWTVPVTILSNEDGEIDLGLCIEEQTGVLRLRRTTLNTTGPSRLLCNLIVCRVMPSPKLDGQKCD